MLRFELKESNLVSTSETTRMLVDKRPASAKCRYKQKGFCGQRRSKAWKVRVLCLLRTLAQPTNKGVTDECTKKVNLVCTAQ